MDPLQIFPELINDLILQHLNHNEILQVSLVSPYWNEVISNSKVIMSKISFNIVDEFLDLYNENHEEIILMKRYRNIKINLSQLLTPNEYITLLESFMDFVVNLNLNQLEVCNDAIESNLNFPKLQKLRIDPCPRVAVIPLFIHHKNLQCLSIDDDFYECGDQKEKRKLLIEFLKLNLQLEQLHINSIFSFLFQSSEHLDFEMKLRKLSIMFPNEDEDINFIYFLSFQKNLKWIVLNDCFNHVVFDKILKDVKTLERLSIEYFDIDSDKVDSKLIDNLHRNNTIKQLDIEACGVNLKFLKPFLTVCKNIEKLYVFHLSQEIFMFLTREMKGLRKLEYCSAFDTFHQHYRTINPNFEAVEKRYVDFINENI